MGCQCPPPLSLNYRPGKEGRVSEGSSKGGLGARRNRKILSCLVAAVFQRSCASSFPEDGEMGGEALVLTTQTERKHGEVMQAKTCVDGLLLTSD